MTLVESIAAEVTREIARSYQYFSLPQRDAITKLIVRKFEHVVPEPQQALHFTDADEKANKDQCAAILALLKKRRSEGATTIELNAICCNYTARVSELRIDQHYKIHCTRGVGRNFTYRLHETDW